ncbi:hypothetical protein [Streptomyces sp. RerS4]|uniref:hypothetical protein n=1 Tax=Streptomyces sp. RerS4 TaxID=2942449 RepID=UPI00201BC825|nr:hypothetical protein [Streptomyces sp. RerS4]UQX00772.1 hypothetical protein M4D82_09715 [Streptomyces sp. RerS4]
MGMTVLYIAFGVVALWLLAEVLMQYKARLRWRLLAFAGFLGVVAGVVLPSVLVIGVGATAFAIGQTLVTLSFRKGFVAGWALRRGGEPVRQESGRRRGAKGGPRQAAKLEVGDLEYEGREPERAGRSDRADAADPVFTPEPVPEDTGSYGIQSFADRQPDATAAFASPFTTAEQDAHQYAAYQDPQQGQGYQYPGGYGDQQVYAAYSDPYIGTGGAVAPAQPYDYSAYADPTQQQYSMDTPPGGVWVPQQRATDGPPEQQQPAPDPYDPHGRQQPPQGYPYQDNGYRY